MLIISGLNNGQVIQQDKRNFSQTLIKEGAEITGSVKVSEVLRYLWHRKIIVIW